MEYGLHSFYTSSAWRELRDLLIVQSGGRCSRCGRVLADTSQLVGHHLIPLTLDNVGDPAISLNADNVEIICHRCHDEEHHRFGWRAAHRVHLIYGSPCSGKSTLAHELMRQGDILLDIDALWVAISGMPEHVKPPSAARTVFAARDALSDAIKRRLGDWDDAYIVGGYADYFERQRAGTEYGAELIFCECDKDICLRRAEERAKADGISFELQKRYVDEWWDTYLSTLPPPGVY